MSVGINQRPDIIHQKSRKRQKLSHEITSDDVKSRLKDSQELGQSDGNMDGSASESDYGEQSDGKAFSRRGAQGKIGSHGKPATPTVQSKANKPLPEEGFSETDELKDRILRQRSKYDRLSKDGQALIQAITKTIQEIPPTSSFQYAEAKKYAKSNLGVCIPWSPLPAADIKYAFQFASPDEVVKTGVGVHERTLYLQLSTLMPQSVFQEKDFLHHRALQKRSFYLACIAGALIKSIGAQCSFQYAFKDNNELLPVLLVRERQVKQESKNKRPVNIEINPVFPASLGNIEKLLPSRNCLRPEPSGKGISIVQEQSSPFYNSSMRYLSSAIDIEQLIEDARSRSEAFDDVCMLGQIWLEHRGFTTNVLDGGFGTFEWSYTCALLLSNGGHKSRPLFSSRYSAIQLFKAMLQVLSAKDFTQPFVVQGDLTLDKQDGVPIFFDAEKGINLFYKTQPWSYARLKTCAAQALVALNSKSGIDPMVALNTEPFIPVLEYDETYTVNIRPPKSTSTVVHSGYIRSLHAILAKACGDRVKAIELTAKPHPAWAITSNVLGKPSEVVYIGLLIDASNTSRLIDRGPSVEDKLAAEDFRAFWGEKAELRKFVDDGIVESLVWSSEESVTTQIIRFVMQKHFDITADMIQISSRVEVSELPNPQTAATNAFKLVNDSYQNLSDTLRSLEELPLQVRSINAGDAALRSATVQLPVSHQRVTPMNVILELDTSGRWPESLPAINHTKVAFLTKIGDLIAATNSNVATALGIEHLSTSASGYLNNPFLDITYASISPDLMPITFRLRIHHSPIEGLLTKLLKQRSLSGANREQLQLALHITRRTFIAAGSHTTAIKNLVTHFAPLSTTIRLVKKWFQAHYLAVDIPAEVIEVICAHVFLDPYPWSIPGSPTTAFLRVLQFLSTWDWTTTPLIVDLSLSQDAFSAAQREEFVTRFRAWRSMDPGMNNVTWFIATNVDNTGVVWTQMAGVKGRSKPEKITAGRVRALATAALNEVIGCDRLLSKAVLKSIFTSELDDYDFVLHLDPTVVGRGDGNTAKKKQFKNLQVQKRLDVDTSGFDIVEAYLADLEQAFGDNVIFFVGGSAESTDTICGLWRPHVGGTKEWKIRLGLSTVPVKDKEESTVDHATCETNFDGMLAEMALLGEGIVSKISRKGQD